jgi:hypothetical protein
VAHEREALELHRPNDVLRKAAREIELGIVVVPGRRERDYAEAALGEQRPDLDQL